MAKQTKRTKEKRQGAQAGVKAAQFFKKNIYVILMILCILAIVTMITVAVVLNNSGDQPAIKPLPSGDDVHSGEELPPDNKPDEKPDVKPDPKPDEKPDPKPDEPVKKDFIMSNPLDEFTLGKAYSEEHVFDSTLGQWATHEGLDFNAAAGSEVKCVFEGKVTEVIEDDGYHGAAVTIEHQDGFTTVYKLLDGVKLTVGDSVNQGDVIGVISSTAMDEMADGEHMHLELYKDGVALNPLDYMIEGDK